MTMSLTKELFTPFENPKREFCSYLKLFKTLSLDESSSPELDLFTDLEEHSEEEVAETMVETMEEYTCKTRGDYGSGVTRSKIDDKDHFELKEMQEVILFYNGLKVSTRQILDSKGAIPTKTATDAKVAIQEMAEFSQKWHNGTYRQSMKESLSKFVNESAKRHEENSNLIKEIRASIDAAIRNQGDSIKALEIQIGQISKVLQERGSGSLHSSTKMNPRDHVNSISTTVETGTTPIRCIRST
ncbi:hypothetical protein Tco_0680295 [Tanacetum coccineum]|uniref:Uncharacterized protein n=1 Tax=Tanacetum coccineum TaxID=301880 RepID=A0ABQ4XLK6_9ASTR